MSGLEGVGSVLEEAGGSGFGLTSSSSAYVRQSSCDTRGWGREAQSEINLKEFSPEMAQKKNYSEQLRKKDVYGVSCVHSIFFSKHSFTLDGKHPQAAENICFALGSQDLMEHSIYSKTSGTIGVLFNKSIIKSVSCKK